MKIEGRLTVDAPVLAVWSALLDPKVIAACIPGCSEIEQLDADRFRGTIAMKLGPIEPTFEVEVAITERVEGQSIASTTRGQEGSRASVLSSNNRLILRETSCGGTEVAYESLVSVTGRLGKFGLGLMRKTAERLAVEFGASLGAVLKEKTLDHEGGEAKPAHTASTQEVAAPPGEPLSLAGQRYAERVQRLSSGLQGEEFSYGQDPQQRLTVFPSPCPDGRVLLFWHGGGWTSGHRDWMNFMAPALTAAGITFVTASYRLAPAHTFPAGFNDCADAVAWLFANACRFQAHPGKIFVGGHSAGGHWAALLAVRRDWQAPRELPPDVLRGCLPVSGVYLFGPDSGLSMRPRLLGPNPTEEEASPLRWVQKTADALAGTTPFLLACADRDFSHLRMQAKAFSEALKSVGARVELFELRDCDHFDASVAAGDAAGEWMPRALAFMSAESSPKAKVQSTHGRPGAPVLALRNVCFEYALSRDGNLKVVDRISLELRRGEVMSILGPSGCGKSTLLNIAAGLIRSQQGVVEVEGVEATGIPGKTGFMMQRDELLPWRTVLENVLLGPEIIRGRVSAEDRQKAVRLLSVAGLGGFEHHYPGALSGGMRQRAAFVRTLMLDRSVALLDEPFGALDAITRSEMQEWLLEMQRQTGQSLLMITHDIDEAIFMSDRVLVMSSRPGRIALEIDIPFVKPRNFEDIVTLPEYGAIKSRLLKAIRSPSAAVGRARQSIHEGAP